jgi:type VI secretion system secreted protein VgrG
MPVTQKDRFLQMAVEAQGKDDFILVNFSGSEAMSRLFSYQLEVLSEKDSIAPKDIIGKKISWTVQYGGDKQRLFKGYISHLSVGGRGLYKMFSYRLTVVPWLWFLTCTANCRIFQGKAVDEIIKSIFSDFGYSDFKIDLKGSHPARDYCVQYRETAFNFISRLMEDEGIFYYFNHEERTPSLLIADDPASYTNFPANSVHLSTDTQPFDHISSWEHQFQFRPGKYTHTDYNFETPSTSLLATQDTIITDVPDAKKFEIFDYPGDYLIGTNGTARAKLRIEEDEAPYHTVAGASNCCTFTPGGKFQIEDVDSERGNIYLVRSIRHSGSDTNVGNISGESEYSNTFDCIPAKVKYRPLRITPKPVVHGTQTAVVVGPAGSEIYTDKYSRIKVQFYWDRLGKVNENSSCWVRVATPWAGKQWGMIHIPRMGQEVVVDFLEGDPDQPLVIGSVYNAEQMPPYALPANRTQSGIKTRSSLGGGAANFNEIRFEDKMGSEMLTVHAEKDQEISVEHDESHTVGHDRTKTIGHDETTEVKNNRTETVDANETITVHGNRTETVDKNETITVHQNRTETVDQNETITVSQNRTRTVSQNETITVSMMRTHTVGINEAITVGAAQEITVGAAQTISVGGSQAVTIGAEQTTSVGGSQTVSIAKDLSESVGGSESVSVGKDYTIKVEKNFSLNAGESITLTTGDASISMQKDGTISIKGKDITVEASGEINVKASKNITMKGQKILQN